ncbi:hypothetical protein WJX73_000485 [Symbiochloris irregularis]|uniref:Dynein regulatory complex subunit 7 MORN domain-containing protein n=1 Tax=Symbiochloris irregularis TaxID=706552 RepID=A0AAW1P7W5_9CHLO
MPELNLSLLAQRLAEARDSGVLSLGYLELDKLPPELQDKAADVKLQSLSEADLSSNKLSELPPLALFKALQILRLKYNVFTRMPAALLGLPRLEVLEMAGNQLTQLDERILSVLPKLRELDVSNNQLTELPDAVRLDASSNMLSTVPAVLGASRTLKELNIRYNSQMDAMIAAKSEEGLSKLLSHLREVAEQERLAGIEALKPVGSQAGSFTEYRVKADAAQRQAGNQEPLDNRCWVRTGHSMVRMGNMLAVVGGTVLGIGEGQRTMDAFWATDDRMEWHRQEPPAGKDRPVTRDSHVCVANGNEMVMYSGRNQEGRRLNDVWTLDSATWHWKRVPTQGAVPPQRHSAVAAFHRRRLVVIGGCGAEGPMNDVWALDLAELPPSWKQVNTTGPRASLRQSAAFCLSGDTLYVHGGCGNFILGDLFALDLATLQWRELGLMGSPKLQGHTLTVHGDHLWICGGLDEGGNANTRLWRLDLKHCLSQRTTVRPVWTEMDVQLPMDNITHAHTAAFLLHGGRLEVIQSRVDAQLVAAHADDPSAAGAHWNILRSAPLESFAEKSIHAPVLPAGDTAKSARIGEQMKRDEAGNMAPSASTTSRVEAEMLDYVDSWTAKLQAEDPAHEMLPLILAPRNEMGVRKFVCTSMCPIRSEHPNLATLDGCCTFVADYIQYEVLQPLSAPPASLVSPSAMLQWQAGDSFDMANLLCCLLLGAGYDAFMAMQKAQQRPCVTSGPQKPLTQARAALEAQQPVQAEGAVNGAAPEATEASVAEGAAEALPVEEPAAPPAPPKPPLHAWVLVLKGKREVAQSFFVESSTGRAFPVGSAPYTGIQCLWNQHNVWVAMPGSCTSATMGAADTFELEQSSKWLCMLNHPAYQHTFEAGQTEGAWRKNKSSATMGGSKGGSGAGPSASTGSRTQSLGLTSHSMGATMKERKASMSAFAAHRPQVPPSQPPPAWHAQPGMPGPWVSAHAVTPDMVDKRCPTGARSRAYLRCTRDSFAWAGLHARWDGMIERISLYEDEERTQLEQTRELFLRRGDKLHERITRPTDGTVLELFGSGASGALTSLWTARDGRYEAHFQTRWRHDGLVRRAEMGNGKAVEEFQGRSDGLVYRSARFSARVPAGMTVEKTSVWASPIFLFDGGNQLERPIFKLGLSELKLQALVADLLQQAESSLVAIRAGEKETTGLVDLRRQQECGVRLAWPYPEADRDIQSKRALGPEQDANAGRSDYLAAFLPARLADSPSAVMTPEEGDFAKSKCMQALTTRLADRAELIKARKAALQTSISEHQVRQAEQALRDAIPYFSPWALPNGLMSLISIGRACEFYVQPASSIFLGFTASIQEVLAFPIQRTHLAQAVILNMDTTLLHCVLESEIDSYLDNLSRKPSSEHTAAAVRQLQEAKKLFEQLERSGEVRRHGTVLLTERSGKLSFTEEELLKTVGRDHLRQYHITFVSALPKPQAEALHLILDRQQRLHHQSQQAPRLVHDFYERSIGHALGMLGPDEAACPDRARQPMAVIVDNHYNAWAEGGATMGAPSQVVTVSPFRMGMQTDDSAEQGMSWAKHVVSECCASAAEHFDRVRGEAERVLNGHWCTDDDVFTSGTVLRPFERSSAVIRRCAEARQRTQHASGQPPLALQPASSALMPHMPALIPDPFPFLAPSVPRPPVPAPSQPLADPTPLQMAIIVESIREGLGPEVINRAVASGIRVPEFIRPTVAAVPEPHERPNPPLPGLQSEDSEEEAPPSPSPRERRETDGVASASDKRSVQSQSR